MPYFNFENGVTAINDTNLNAMQKGLMQLVFPIGSTYITQDNTNPATILEFGTWERLKGKVCLGLAEDDEDLDEIGKTGGEKEHTLTLNELPAKEYITNENGSITLNVGSGNAHLGTQQGGGQAHNNMQPFEVVGYMWIRRA